jgi:hypothetical protein
VAELEAVEEAELDALLVPDVVADDVSDELAVLL